MPGFHSKKEKRQAKHIIAGYKKRGVSSDTAKHIAWATVNKQKNESWQFNGAGQPVYIGNQGNVSQFDPSGMVSPGQPYLPDEVAKMLVKESGLRKMDTVPKRVIVRYLESMGLSAGLAVDVAKVLRDVYGITPIFDEETLLSRSGALIEEITKTMDESFPMPFIDDSEPRELTEVETIGSFIQNEYMESKDEDYDLVLGHLAMLSPSEFRDVVSFHEAVGSEMFNYLEQLVVDGESDVAEHVLNGICFPNAIKFMPEHVQALFDEDAADDVIKAGTSKMRAKMPKIPPIPKGPKPAAAAAPKKPGMAIPKIKSKPSVPSLKVQMRKHGQDLPGDKLAAKKPGAALAAHRDKQDKEWGDKLAAAKARHADEPAKAVPKPGLGSKLKKAGAAALGVMKKIHTPSAHNPDVGPALKKIAHGAGRAALGVAGAAGHLLGAHVRGIKKGLSGGSSSDHEPESAPAKRSASSAEAPKKPGLIGRVVGGLARAAGRFAKHVVHSAKQGFHDATPGIRSQMPKGDEPKSDAAEPKKRVAKSAVGESLISELTTMLSEGSYPDLGKTPYGPAGDPKKGPELAKSWMTPQPAGSMEPHGGEVTRMFSDPDEREKARKAKLADVMAALDGMRQQAAAAGVPPEGMFLNLYRDMHREKVRYS